jgi:valyl-tRNA synthetase
MPFITEELYSFMPYVKESDFLMSTQWPRLPDQFVQPEIEAKVERIFEVVRGFRALRADLALTPGAQIPMACYEGDLLGSEAVVRSQAWIVDLREGRPDEPHITTTVAGVDLHLPLGDIDKGKELERIERDEAKAQEDLGKLEVRLNDPTFIERAKPEVVERTQAQAEELRERLAKLVERRKLFA